MLQQIIQLIDSIKVNKQNGAFAVYKPLLLMIVLRHVLEGGNNEFKFKEISPELELLMEKYGWQTIGRKKAEYPFYFLASSSLWEIDIAKSEIRFPDAPTRREMENSVGKLNDKIYAFLVNDTEATKTVIEFINKKYFKGEFAF